MIAPKLLQNGGNLSVEGGNSDTPGIAAKWGNSGTCFGHFCPIASISKGGNSDTPEIAAKWGTKLKITPLIKTIFF